MPIQNGVLRFGFAGDGGVGNRLLQEVMEGRKTATCLPVLEMSAEMLREVRDAPGKTIVATTPEGDQSCLIRVTRVYETSSGDPAPSMLLGEGYGDDAASFVRDHYAERLASLPDVLGAVREEDLDRLVCPPPAHRAVVELHDLLGWSLTEIAEGLDRSDELVRQHLRRGRLLVARGTHREPSCRRLRRALRGDIVAGAAITLPDDLLNHAKACASCSALIQRLDGDPMIAGVEGVQSWDEAEIFRTRTGRDPSASIRFLVVEFEPAA